MKIYNYDIVFQEVPDHISLAFYVCGCPLKCPGCHSPELWTEKSGFPLSISLFLSLLDRYRNKIDCVLFLGGEWHCEELVQFLKEAQSRKLKTALYTGLDEVPAELRQHLTFLKTGPWKQELGGLSSPLTNQAFIDLTTNSNLNHLF
ncbi:MAG: anaerobic ribonucleoside-triphosphate reductase activating protein [Bdellovibrio sp.]|nr:anaerobic ribonucleoside-triphosphate reductase activating protein [Bdellovibrio sp.]